MKVDVKAKSRRATARPRSGDSPSDPKGKTEAMARLALDPAVAGAVVVQDFTKCFGEQDISALIQALNTSIASAQGGDLSQAEAMLYAQANALQGIFMGLAHRASQQGYLRQWEALMRVALKAQNQCRMTLETLAALKNPAPMVIAKQANITTGPQQVNNGLIPTENQPSPSKLLEPQNGQWLDPRTTIASGNAHPVVEAVGTLQRPPDCDWQGRGESKCLQGRNTSGDATFAGQGQPITAESVGDTQKA